MNVPTMTNAKVRHAHMTDQRLNAPRWRYTVKLWMSATPTIHDSKLAFSTGVPTPVAAPAEHDVGPHAAKANANAQEQPRNHSEAARALDPFLRRVVHDERRDSVCKRNGKTRIADETA